MKKLKYLAISLAITCGAGACSDDFLDLSNPNELVAETFYSKLDNFHYSLNSVYSATKSLDLFGQAFYIQTLLALPHESDYWNAQCRNEVTAGDGNMYLAWRGWYRVVARANDLIENAPTYVDNYNPDASQQAELNQILGQAHFLRGFAYFHMVRLWGESTYAKDSSALSVPLHLKVATTRDEMMKPRASVGTVYHQIIADLELAESLLPESWDDSNIARVNQYAAKGYLGKVHLFMEDFDKAKTYFEEVINSGQYSLVTFDQYDDIFQGKLEYSEESIFELSYTIDMQQNIWENGLGSGIALTLAPPGRGWSNCTPHGVNIFRFGSDPRIKICTFAPTDSAANIEGKMVPAGKSEFNYTGHSFRKYVPADYSVYSTNRNSGINYVMMRLSDIYLMYAEALNETGNDALAAEYMNKVRRRAYDFPPNTPEPTVDYSLAGIQLRDSIREERFRELFAEGHRWYDLVRWGIVEQEVKKYNEYRVTQGEIIYNDKDYYYPVPLQEIDNNPNMEPSSGYE